jgi:endo-1,4-beta-xylanase
MVPTRRRLLHAMAGMGISASASVPLPTLQPPAPLPPDPFIPVGPPGLGTIAAAHGRTYGAAVQSWRFAKDEVYAQLAVDECGLLMPDYETKFAVLQPEEGKFSFGPLDALIAWARRHGKPLRGHGLVWHQDLPDWATQALDRGPDAARALITNHIGRVLAHTQGEIFEWDVLNEVVADPAGSDTPQTTPGELRDTPFLRALGPDYIGFALRTAKQTDPRIRVVLNEYGLEEAAPHNFEKRRRFLNLVRALRKQGVPLDAVGLQGHLQMVQPFAGPPFTEFCRKLRAEGLDLVVTEMDIREHWKLPDGGLPGRDRAVADRIRAFVDAALNGGVKVFVTWGLMDKYSWLASEVHVKRQDGLEHRGLPWDDDGHRKLFWLAMAQTLGRA